MCVSLRVPDGAEGEDVASPIRVHRLIETFYPVAKRIVVDLFLENASARPVPLHMLHRGSLSASYATESWEPHSKDSTLAELAARIVRLHEYRDEGSFVVNESSVTLQGEVFVLDSRTGPLEPEIGGDVDRDEPFTTWIISVPAAARKLVRLELQFGSRSAMRQTGSLHGELPAEFFAYGDEVMIAEIQWGDLDMRRGDYDKLPNADIFAPAFREFATRRPVVPQVFEYLLASPLGVDLGLSTTVIAPKVLELAVPNDLRSSTQYFELDIAGAISSSGHQETHKNGFELVSRSTET